MAVLRIGKEFLLDYGKLDRPLQVKISEVFGRFADATHTGIHLEKINTARYPRYRSIRIDNFWRGIVLAPESGNTYLLLRVLPHDDAYAWAGRHELTVNSATGGIDIGDIAALDAMMPALDVRVRAATDAVSVGTMHRMKGLEFRCLAVAGVGTAAVPAPNAVTPAAEDPHTHERDIRRERSLLFVACTRAREQLAVTWHGPASPFLAALAQVPATRA
ncbi:3'-5' exonuclease [Nocardia arizonensis]|uniref:3'-5' exonuclease n=1 Tax=Nocardia arizonensis TaxID=1141647 RepID=UPI0006CF52C8|nr:3'-5' exonuclease [Nocardia arizonensis]